MLKKVIIAIYVASFFLIIAWILQLIQGEIPYIDQWTRALVATLEGTVVYDFFSFMTIFGGRHFLIPFTIILALILWLIYKKMLPAIVFGLGTYGGHLFNEWIKVIVQRERPSISVALGAEGYSFPSGHTMNAIICYGILAYFLTKKIQSKNGRKLVWSVASLMIVIVGFSRYVVNVHYLTDVIAGYFFGSLYVIPCYIC